MLSEEKKELNSHVWQLKAQFITHTQDKYSNTVMLDKQDMIMKMY